MSKETETMKAKRKNADVVLKVRKRWGYRKKLWEAIKGTYIRKKHGEI